MNISCSILITTYNWKEALKKVLISVSNQTVLPKEVVIADDGSTEDTAKLISFYKKNFPTKLIHCWHEDKGFRAASIRNKAIAKMTSEYVVMIDGDMYLDKNFIADHLRAANKNFFLQGSRVITSESRSKQLLNSNLNLSFLSKGISNRLNAINSPFLSHYFSKQDNNLNGTKTCNFSAWKSDLLEVNGFNEDYIGWGREDSDLAARLIHSGKNRLRLRFTANAYHLYHDENSRNRLSKNDSLLENCINTKQKRCTNGIDKYL